MNTSSNTLVVVDAIDAQLLMHVQSTRLASSLIGGQYNRSKRSSHWHCQSTSKELYSWLVVFQLVYVCTTAAVQCVFSCSLVMCRFELFSLFFHPHTMACPTPI
jgi:hypothetical protein